MLGRTYVRILDIVLVGEQNMVNIAFEFVSGADFRYVLQRFSRPDSFEGVLGPSLAGKRPTIKTKTHILVS